MANSHKALRWQEALPIVVRELRVAARRRFTYRLRLIVAIFGAVEIAFAAMLPISSVEAGRFMFIFTALLMMAICGGAGLILTADSISREKRDGTLGLLFLTRLGGADIVLGKLAAGALSGVSVAFAAMPFLAFSLCLGGITGREFWIMCGLILVLLAFSLSLGMLISALFRSESAVALTFCLIVGLPVVLTPFAVMKWGVIPEGLALWNPFFPAAAFLDPWERFFSHRVAISALWRQLLLIPTMLAIASLILPFVANSKPVRERFKLRLWRPRRVQLNNPVLWLTQRHNQSILLLLLCASLWVVSLMAGTKFYEAELAFVGLMAFLPKLFVLWHSSGLMAAERQSGFLETLLTTPLSAADVLRGKATAIRRQVAPALIFGLLLQYATMMKWVATDSGVTLRSTLLMVAMLTLLVDAHSAAWIGLWQGLLARDRRRALIRTLLIAFLIPWVPILVCYATLFFMFEPTWMTAPINLAGPALIASNIISFGLGCVGLARLHDKFRSSATAAWSFKTAS